VDPSHVVRGQYRGYRAEQGVAPDSDVETYAAVRLSIESWRWANPAWLQSVNVLLLTVPLTILFAWVFFRFCERPFMVRSKAKSVAPQAAEVRPAWTAMQESQPSTVSD